MATNNFAFGVKVILSPENTHPDDGTKSWDERTGKVICRGGAPSKKLHIVVCKKFIITKVLTFNSLSTS